MKKPQKTRPKQQSRIVASLREAVYWVEGKPVPIRITTAKLPHGQPRA